MKKFDIVWSKGRIRFSDINVPARDVESAIAAVRAKHGAWMVETIVSVTEYVPPAPLLFPTVHAWAMPDWGTRGT